MALFDQLIDEECLLEKLEVKVKRRPNSPGPAMRKSVEAKKENWEFLLQNTTSKGECLDDKMDSLIQNVKKISCNRSINIRSLYVKGIGKSL